METVMAGYYLRHSNSERHVPRRMGPLSPSHPAVLDDHRCFCGRPFAAGDYVTLVPLGPGPDSESQRKAVHGGWYTAIAAVGHWECVAGKDDE